MVINGTVCGEPTHSFVGPSLLFWPRSNWVQLQGALGEAMRLKSADTGQDVFVQALVTLERGSKMLFSHVPTARLALLNEHQICWPAARALWATLLMELGVFCTRETVNNTFSVLPDN